MNGFRQAVPRALSLMRFVLLLVLALSATGCFDAQHEIFRLRDGATIPGLPGRYVQISTSAAPKSDAEAQLWYVVSRDGHGTDYRIVEYWRGKANGKPSATEVGSLRAIPLGHDLYIGQIHYPKAKDPVVYALLLFRVWRSAGVIVRIEEQLPDPEATYDIARRHGVDIWWHLEGKPVTRTGHGISGSRLGLVYFLRSLATVPSRPGLKFARIAEAGQ